MLQSAIIAAGGGAISALVALLAMSGYPGGAVLGYLAPLPLLLVGLALGAAALPVAAAMGIGLVAAFAGIAAAGVYGGLHAFPSWLVVRIALARSSAGADASGHWSSAGAVLCGLVGFAAIVVLIGAIGAWGNVEGSVREVLASALAIAAPTLDPDDRDRMVTQIAPFFLGGMGVMWVTMIAVNGVLAQSLLVRSGRNVRPSPQWSDLSLPDWISFPLVAAALIGLVGDGDLRYLGRNLVLVFLVPYFFVGLAVVHGLARRMSAPGLLLAGFYVILGFAFPGMSALVAALGVIEEWVGVRRRFAVAPPGQGNE
jgi:Predicted membrane protein (DUF2232)